MADTAAKYYALDIHSGKIIWSKNNGAPINSQIKIVSDSLEHYQNRLDISGFNTIKTEISEAKKFYFAEEYHQQYLAKIPNGYCNHGFCQATYNDK